MMQNAWIPALRIACRWNDNERAMLFVTDGACMTSSAWQNPSITYMALTARGAAFAVYALNCRDL